MKQDQFITIDQALLMALKIHDRGHCNLCQALWAGLQLRYQINFLDRMGITIDQFREMINDAQTGISFSEIC